VQTAASESGHCPDPAGCAYQTEGDWWQTFGDSGLNALVEQALANNVDLKQAAVSVNKALYQANILGANLVPEFNASLGANANRNLDTRQNSHSYSSQLGLSYELDLWRKLNAAASAQAWEQRATEQDLAATRLTVINNVADAYFQVAYLNEAIKLTEKTIEQYKQILQIARSKYRHGRVASIEVTQAEQSLLAAENSLLSLQQSRSNTEATLRNLLNLRPGQAMAVQPESFRLPEGGKRIKFISVCTCGGIINDLLNALHVFICLKQAVNAQKILRIDAMSFPNEVRSANSHATFIGSFELVYFVFDICKVSRCAITKAIHLVLPTQSELQSMVCHSGTIYLW